ncbi:MAG: hypothetical protein DRQ10_06425 [Candidatus Hydrothermota bacterium]|nr:MAG: hypothetical protein DRQ10_06425 [Candidatus Hydrothermae bacterium]
MLFQNLLKQIAQQLDNAEIRYMVIGGQAVLIHGEPRFTKDIDITMEITPQNLQQVLEVVKHLGLKILVKNVEKFVKDTWVLPTLDERSGIRVDFIFSFSAYEKTAIERATNVEINGYPVKFASVEDLIIHKIFAGRPRDIEDVRKILLKNRVDENYIKKWLKEFDKALGKNTLKTFVELIKEVKNA